MIVAGVNYVNEVFSYWPVADIGLWNVTLPICKLTLQANIKVNHFSVCKPVHRQNFTNDINDVNFASWVNKVTFDCTVHRDRSNRLCSNVMLNFCFWTVVESYTAYLIEVVRLGIKRKVPNSSGERAAWRKLLIDTKRQSQTGTALT